MRKQLTRERAVKKVRLKLTAVSTLEKQIGLLKRERAALREKCDDLSAQNESLMKNPVTTPEQLVEWGRLKLEYDGMRIQVNRIALWLREFRAMEIANGKHAGKDLADVVIGYMEEGRPKIQ